MVGPLTIRDCNGNKIRWSKCKPNECSIDGLTNDRRIGKTNVNMNLIKIWLEKSNHFTLAKDIDAFTC